ncbi:MAG: hypothetical protein P8M26_09520 [Gammaproteobacteria bacterium]|nr:hypothetical protein [Gammaproteobacteria bacterium]
MKSAVLLSVVIGLSLASIVKADEFPSMVGTWKGTSEAVVLGNPAYYPDRASEQAIPRPSSADFVINLTHQDGRRMWGSVSSSDMAEPWIGVFWNDRKSFQAVDADGQVMGRMVDANTMEVIYTQYVSSVLITSHVVFSRTED